MKASDIISYNTINRTQRGHVEEIKHSIIANGWNGAPILVSVNHAQLITGSHRLQALRELNDDLDLDFDVDELGDIAEDVDDIIDEYCDENDCSIDEICFDDLESVFGGTWVEQYKDEIVEW